MADAMRCSADQHWHRLPAAADVVQRFGLFDTGTACSPEMGSHGTIRCSCHGCSEWKAFVTGALLGGPPFRQYEVFTAELVAALAAWLRQLAKVQNAHHSGPLRVHEVGAGDGRLAHHLALALNASDLTPEGSLKPHLPGRKAAAAADAIDAGVNAADAGASNSATAPSPPPPPPALKDEEGAAAIAFSASDDGSLGLPAIATAPVSTALKGEEGAAVIAISASDDGSLGLRTASPFRHLVMQSRVEEAIAATAPHVVICSWMPLGQDWTAAFRACPSVLAYILIGEADSGMCGHLWLTWGIPHGSCAPDDVSASEHGTLNDVSISQCTPSGEGRTGCGVFSHRGSDPGARSGSGPEREATSPAQPATSLDRPAVGNGDGSGSDDGGGGRSSSRGSGNDSCGSIGNEVGNINGGGRISGRWHRKRTYIEASGSGGGCCGCSIISPRHRRVHDGTRHCDSSPRDRRVHDGTQHCGSSPRDCRVHVGTQHLAVPAALATSRTALCHHKGPGTGDDDSLHTSQCTSDEGSLRDAPPRSVPPYEAEGFSRHVPEQELLQICRTDERWSSRRHSSLVAFHRAGLPGFRGERWQGFHPNAARATSADNP